MGGTSNSAALSLRGVTGGFIGDTDGAGGTESAMMKSGLGNCTRVCRPQKVVR